MKRILSSKKVILCLSIALMMVISMSSVYANSDLKTQFMLWADGKFTLVKSKLDQDHEKALNKEQETLIKQVSHLNINTLKDLENSRSTIQKNAMTTIQTELTSLEVKLDDSFKSKQLEMSGDFDLAVGEVNGTIKSKINEVYEDPTLMPIERYQQVNPASYEEAHKLVEEEIEKTRQTMIQLKKLAEQSQDPHVKHYLVGKVAVLETIIKNTEKN